MENWILEVGFLVVVLQEIIQFVYEGKKIFGWFDLDCQESFPTFAIQFYVFSNLHAYFQLLLLENLCKLLHKRL